MSSSRIKHLITRYCDQEPEADLGFRIDLTEVAAAVPRGDVGDGQGPGVRPVGWDDAHAAVASELGEAAAEHLGVGAAEPGNLKNFREF